MQAIIALGSFVDKNRPYSRANVFPSQFFGIITTTVNNGG